jgi:hypothetical protein
MNRLPGDRIVGALAAVVAVLEFAGVGSRDLDRPACGRRGPLPPGYPPNLGGRRWRRAHYALGPVSRSPHPPLRQHAGAVRASRTNGFALNGFALWNMRLVIPDIRS